MDEDIIGGQPAPRWHHAVLIGAPVLALGVVLFADLDPGHPEVTRTAAVALLMAIWWLTGVAPLAITALLPVILFPALGILDAGDVASRYVNDVIFLFLGGFLVALAMQRWHLHRRIALRLLLFFGMRPRYMLMGFMLPTFFLSMWISNTATTMMIVPIAMAIIMRFEEDHQGNGAFQRYAVGLLLGIAYSASIGGVATLIGTPPNLAFSRILTEMFPEAPEITFANWFVFGFPLALVLLGILWVVLSTVFCRGTEGFHLDRSVIREQYTALGPMTPEEKMIAAVFAALALLWLTRPGLEIGGFHLLGWASLFSNPSLVKDGTVAIAMAVLLFLLPSTTRPGERVMTWHAAHDLPWDIILLLGGGFALAAGFQTSGLSAWVGAQLDTLGRLHPLALVMIICLAVSLLTELTSNTATSQVILPIIAALAVRIGLHPLLLMIPATLACSFAFMLPVATPPNAIVFGTRRLRVPDMLHTGLAFNLVGILLITLATFTLGRLVFGIELDEVPAWSALDGR
ncbi:MAG: SLC13 family permease [Candidatus Hydrogenedentota bacterium]